MNTPYFLSYFVGSYIGLIYYFSRLPNYYFMEKIKNPLKRKVIAEAESYIAEHGYVHIEWFIKEKLGMKVRNSFIRSVASLMTKYNLYLKEPAYENDFKIEKNPNYTKPSKLKLFFDKYAYPLLVTIAGGLIVGYIIYRFSYPDTNPK